MANFAAKESFFQGLQTLDKDKWTTEEKVVKKMSKFVNTIKGQDNAEVNIVHFIEVEWCYSESEKDYYVKMGKIVRVSRSMHSKKLQVTWL